MPELPEVETTLRGISPHIAKQQIRRVIVRQSSLRWPIPQKLAQTLERRKLLSIGRRGKYLLFEFSHGHLLIHLGMSGSLRITAPDEPPQKHDHVDFIFSKNLCLRFHDPRRFGAILWTQEPVLTHPLLIKLGPEPLTETFGGEYLFTKSRKRKKDIKAFIMDSHVVVGVGNIYANEALFDAGIRPTRAAGKVTRQEYIRLVKAIKNVLDNAIRQGGTTLRDFVGGDGKPGYFVQQLNVYGREGLNCKHCSQPLKSIKQSQRATVYCSQCQQ
jgi:formamidopyrimidine-DNA glycosylase